MSTFDDLCAELDKDPEFRVEYEQQAPEHKALMVEIREKKMIERLAALAHEQWSGWMHYLFRFGVENPDGTFTMDADKVARWRRQMSTVYADLPESEKTSDRTEAQKVLDCLRRSTSGTGLPTNEIRADGGLCDADKAATLARATPEKIKQGDGARL